MFEVKRRQKKWQNRTQHEKRHMGKKTCCVQQTLAGTIATPPPPSLLFGYLPTRCSGRTLPAPKNELRLVWTMEVMPWGPVLTNGGASGVNILPLKMK